MSKLLVLGLCGRAGAGKDTVANHLSDQFGFFRVAQGDSIRETFLGINQPSLEILKEVEAAGLTHIVPLQQMGGECKDDIDRPEHWADSTLIKIRYLSHYHPKPRRMLVIPGMRYGVEHGRFREVIEGKWGGRFVSWMLKKPDTRLKGEQAKHKSEIEADTVKCDWTLTNDATTGDLKRKAYCEAHELIMEVYGLRCK